MTYQKKPMPIVPGDDDHIVPIGASAMPSSMILNGTMLKVYSGSTHATSSTIKNDVYADLHAFIKARSSASAY